MRREILILNTEVSGMNKYLFAQLREHGWQLDICDVPFPRRLRWWAYVVSFSPRLTQWKTRFHYHLDKLYKSSWCFRWRSQWCEKTVKRRQGSFDLVLNIAGMYAPSTDVRFLRNLKYAVVCSYTMALSQKYDEWFTYPHEYKKWHLLEKGLYQNADVVLTTNQNVIRSLERDYQVDPQKIVEMGYGLTFDNFPEFEKHYDGRTILFVGFDFKRKGGFVLLEAFKKIKADIQDARLVIIGPSKKSYHIDQDGVEFLGPVADREIVQGYFRQASLFVMPSLCEPFGLVFLEAMAYKLPCIASTVDAMPEIIRDGETGYLVDPDDVNGLADRITSLLLSEEKMKRMGAAASCTVKSRYTWEQVGNIVNQHLLEGVERGR